MAVRFYLMPLEVVTMADGNPARGPKYLAWKYDPDPPALIADVDWELRDYGLEPTALLAANVDASQHAALAAQPDVTAVPANLDANVGANLATVQAALEALNIPADVVVGGTTYRQIVRGVMGIFALAQRFNGRLGNAGRLFPPGITLSTTLAELSAGVRNALQSTADELGYDRSSLTGGSDLRDVLKVIAQQASPSPMLGVTV